MGFVLGFAKLLQLRFGIPWDSGFGIRSFLQLPFGIRFGIRSTFTNSDGQLHMESTTPHSLSILGSTMVPGFDFRKI